VVVEDLQDVIFKSGAVFAFTPLLSSVDVLSSTAVQQILSILQVLIVEDRDGRYKEEMIASGLVTALTRFFHVSTTSGAAIDDAVCLSALQLALLLLQTDDSM
jgi:hypothetical protein